MRLTYRDGRGRWCALVDGREVSGAIVERLAAYEETGLAPEEVEDVLHRFSQVLLETTNNRMSKTNYTLDAMLAEIEDARKEDCERYCELKQAQAEGRLGVLPCKVGDTVYHYGNDGRIYESKVTRLIFVTTSIAFAERAVGETVFLNIAEAEAAAKKYANEHRVCGGCIYWKPPGREFSECRILARTGRVFSNDPACMNYEERGEGK